MLQKLQKYLKETNQRYSIFQHYLYYLPGRLPIVLDFLIQADSYASDRLETDKSYFMCTKTFASELQMPDISFLKSIDDLVRLGYIEKQTIVDKRGSRRYIKINEDALLELARRHALDHQKVAKENNIGARIQHVQKQEEQRMFMIRR